MNKVEKIPSGYKQTELGIIPENWMILRLNEISKVVDSLHQTPNFVEDGFAMVRVADIKPGTLNLERTLRVNGKAFQEYTKNYQPKQGDIVLSRVESYGISSFVDTKELFCIGQNTVVIVPNVDNKYLYYVLNSTVIRKQIEDGSFGSGYKSLSLKNIKELKLQLPKSKSEQTTIATVLSDTDALIEHLGKLIAKKKAIKQGAMQQLLTGKRRLPGFSGEWEVKTVKEVVQVPVSDGPHLTPKFIERGIPFLSVNNLVDNKINFKGMRFISAEDHKEFSKKCKPQKGDILLGKAASVGLVAVANLEIEFNIWSPIAVIRLQENHNPYFFYYSFQNKTIIDNMRLLTNSSSQGNLGMGDIEKIKFSVPTRKEEQDAIVRILSDIDTEIERLEKKLSKYRQIKTGMMQQLFTGKIRIGKNLL